MVCLAKYFISVAIGDTVLREHASLATVIFSSFTLSTPSIYNCRIRTGKLEGGRWGGEDGGMILFYFVLLHESDVLELFWLSIAVTLDEYCIDWCYTELNDTVLFPVVGHPQLSETYIKTGSILLLLIQILCVYIHICMYTCRQISTDQDWMFFRKSYSIMQDSQSSISMMWGTVIKELFLA